MTNKAYDKTLKKVNDVFSHYKELTESVDKTKLDKTYFNSFLANSLILKITELNNKDYKKIKKELKRQKVFDKLLDNTFARKVKKRIIKISPKLYYKLKKR